MSFSKWFVTRKKGVRHADAALIARPAVHVTVINRINARKGNLVKMKLSSLISDGVIFQHGKEIRVFGEGKGVFSASFLGETREIRADGKFCVTFSPHSPGGPYKMEVNLDGEKKTIQNIMIGEVIVISGQSNAELAIRDTSDCDTAFCADDNVRFYMVTRPTADKDRNIIVWDTPFNERWTSLTEENAKEISAIGLHAALYYRKKLNIPVGIIACYKGASTIQAFLSEESNARFALDAARVHVDTSYWPWNKPAYLRHMLLEKLFPVSVGAFVFYQGESNRTEYEAVFYADMLVTLIAEIREGLKAPDLKVVIVQINDFPTECETGVHAIQNAQELASKRIPNCALVRINDLGEHGLIHPRNKREVTDRICKALDSL